MKIFNVDVSVKYIRFELDGSDYLVQFRFSLRKGIYDISVWKDGQKTNAKVPLAYSPLKQWFPEIWRIWFPVWLYGITLKLRQSHNR